NEANIALACKIADSDNREAIKELVENLSNKDRNIQSDCIKTLYETAYRKPELLAEHVAVFLDLLKSKNNRMVWGTMIALSTLADLKHKELFDALDLISETMQNGSVITIDAGVEILSRLNTFPAYTDKVEPLLIEQLWKCPIKQLPQYAEKAVVSATKANREIFSGLLLKRIPECTGDSQRKRLEKVRKQWDHV
ncbi:MAG TPA: hypothetical protein PLK12_08815, partial [Prolixibacteraceae bacterium]|nr:hypothetical protein [Prolixibacteraceae bacterium]